MATDLKDVTARIEDKVAKEYEDRITDAWNTFTKVINPRNKYVTIIIPQNTGNELTLHQVGAKLIEGLKKLYLPEVKQAAIDDFIKQVEELSERMDNLESVVGN